MTFRLFIVVACALCLHPARGDTLSTLDHQTFHGTVTFLAPGFVTVTNHDSLTNISLDQIRQIHLAPAPAEPDHSEPSNAALLASHYTNHFVAIPTAGLLTRDGSFLAQKVDRMDDTRVTLHGSNDGLVLNRINTAAIFFSPISLHHAQRLRHAGAGLLLRNGDFVEGRLESVDNDRVTITSLLFGPRHFSTSDDAVALLLHQPATRSADYSVHTPQGSHFLATGLEIENNGLVLNQSPFQHYRIPLDPGLIIRRQPATNILQSAWHRLDNTSANLRHDLLQRVEIPNLEKEASEANLVRARNIWDDCHRTWNNKHRDYLQAHSQLASARTKAQSEERQVASARHTLERAEETLTNKIEQVHEAEDSLGAAREKLASITDNTSARSRAEEKVREASRSLETARRELDHAMSRLERVRARLDKAIGDSREAAEKVRHLAEIETVARRELDLAKREADQAKAAFDLAMARLL